MQNELKTCPFCGKMARKHDAYYDRIYCGRNQCVTFGMNTVTPEEWNTRAESAKHPQAVDEIGLRQQIEVAVGLGKAGRVPIVEAIIRVIRPYLSTGQQSRANECEALRAENEMLREAYKCQINDLRGLSESFARPVGRDSTRAELAEHFKQTANCWESWLNSELPDCGESLIQDKGTAA
ncbi:MAG: hypothetical protein K8U57_37120 [Planctomycetes bacterium]|nr:hypothetical protein [Planctomycetota bacterium]